MTSWDQFMAHLDVLTDAGHPPVCRTVPGPAQLAWTSERPQDHARAAEGCASCAVLGACRDYGLEHPREVGVYGGLTGKQRIDKTNEARP